MLSMIKVTQTEGNQDSTTVKFETKHITSNLGDSSGTYILVTGNITATDLHLKIVLHFWNA